MTRIQIGVVDGGVSILQMSWYGQWRLSIRLSVITLSMIFPIGVLATTESSALAAETQCSQAHLAENHSPLPHEIRRSENHVTDPSNGNALEKVFFTTTFLVPTKDAATGQNSTAPAGYVNIEYTVKSKELFIDFMSTEPENRGKGVASTLIKDALERFPESQTIRVGTLAMTNWGAVAEGLKQGMTLEESIKLSPIYKIEAHLGFTEFVPDPRMRVGKIGDMFVGPTGYTVKRPDSGK